MPYQVYQLYQIDRPKSAAEIRLADEQLGRAVQSVSKLWHWAAGPIAVVWPRYRGSVPPVSRPDSGQPAVAVAGSSGAAVANRRVRASVSR